MDIVLGVGLNSSGRRGIDYFMSSLLDSMADLDRDSRFLVLSYFFTDFERRRAGLPCPARPNFELKVPRWPERLVRALEFGWGVPLVEQVFLRGRHVDVYHALDGRLPHLSGAKLVTTVYDMGVELAFAARPGFQPGTAADETTRETVQRADRVVAVSEATKRDLMRLYPVPESKVVVIPTGVDPKVLRPVPDPAARSEVRKRYSLPEKFVLGLGPFEPKRDAESLLRAFAALRREGADQGHFMVLAGQPSAYGDGLRRLAQELGVGDRLRMPGYVAREDLAAVFGLATVFAHPTVFDGFGTVSLEAMACGAPTVTTDIPAVVEAVGDAALTVPPRDSGALAKAVRRVLENAELRAQLSTKGVERASHFTYDRIARRHLDLYAALGRPA